jgi:ABC-type multidrug transport system ATPase subunit
MFVVVQASGAGKTTLLNVLNFRNRGNLSVTGNVKVNGNPITSALQLASISGYVQQDDLFIGTLTVKEHLKFQAMLRMEENTPVKSRLDRVEEILNDVNMFAITYYCNFFYRLFFF